jgi:hypothetical protein
MPASYIAAPTGTAGFWDESQRTAVRSSSTKRTDRLVPTYLTSIWGRFSMLRRRGRNTKPSCD